MADLSSPLATSTQSAIRRSRFRRSVAKSVCQVDIKLELEDIKQRLLALEGRPLSTSSSASRQPEPELSPEKIGHRIYDRELLLHMGHACSLQIDGIFNRKQLDFDGLVPDEEYSSTAAIRSFSGLCASSDSLQASLTNQLCHFELDETHPQKTACTNVDMRNRAMSHSGDCETGSMEKLLDYPIFENSFDFGSRPQIKQLRDCEDPDLSALATAIHNVGGLLCIIQEVDGMSAGEYEEWHWAKFGPEEEVSSQHSEDEYTYQHFFAESVERVLDATKADFPRICQQMLDSDEFCNASSQCKLAPEARNYAVSVIVEMLIENMRANLKSEQAKATMDSHIASMRQQVQRGVQEMFLLAESGDS